MFRAPIPHAPEELANLAQQADFIFMLQVRMIFNFIDGAHAQVGRSNSLSQSCR